MSLTMSKVKAIITLYYLRAIEDCESRLLENGSDTDHFRDDHRILR